MILLILFHQETASYRLTLFHWNVIVEIENCLLPVSCVHFRVLVKIGVRVVSLIGRLPKLK
jgi:hypothetical protein